MEKQGEFRVTRLAGVSERRDQLFKQGIDS
jgi:hypothetical protein